MFFVYKMGFSASASETSKAASEDITVSNHGQRSRATLKTRRIHVPIVKHQTHATTLNTPTSRLITQSWPFTAAAFQQRTELSTIRKLWTKLRCSSPATTCNQQKHSRSHIICKASLAFALPENGSGKLPRPSPNMSFAATATQMISLRPVQRAVLIPTRHQAI